MKENHGINKVTHVSLFLPTLSPCGMKRKRIFTSSAEDRIVRGLEVGEEEDGKKTTGRYEYSTSSCSNLVEDLKDGACLYFFLPFNLV